MVSQTSLTHFGGHTFSTCRHCRFVPWVRTANLLGGQRMLCCASVTDTVLVTKTFSFTVYGQCLCQSLLSVFNSTAPFAGRARPLAANQSALDFWRLTRSERSAEDSILPGILPIRENWNVRNMEHCVQRTGFLD